MSSASDKTENERVASVRRQIRKNEQHAKKMLGLWKRAVSGHAHFFGIKPARKKSVRGRATRGAGTGKTEAVILKIHGGRKAGDRYAERSLGARLIDSNMLGSTAIEREREWEIDVSRHPNVKSDMFVHVSLSRGSGGDLSDRDWKKLTRTFLAEIGCDGQYTSTKHEDTKCPHIHIILSRSLRSAKLLNLWQNRWAWRAALRRAEISMGLTATERPAEAERERVSTSDAQVNATRRAQRLGGRADPFIDPKILAQALAQSTTREQFSDHLKAVGIELATVNKNGRTTGLLYNKPGCQALSGSLISRQFTLPAVQKRLESNRIALQERLIQRQRRAEQQRALEQAQNHRYFERGGG